VEGKEGETGKEKGGLKHEKKEGADTAVCNTRPASSLNRGILGRLGRPVETQIKILSWGGRKACPVRGHERKQPGGFGGGGVVGGGWVVIEVKSNQCTSYQIEDMQKQTGHLTRKGGTVGQEHPGGGKSNGAGTI